ncbi:hypothetical protein GCM10011361_16380 [Muriicola marianensis]|uniref:Uncharacterized protein n=1 Tax=Muriicola marianensis TaxID=1324801 RepID=A0ABQ1QYY0_9FLAO|nr:hypothetical protein GCM10011361_16380 [Muriicola marianensis]
MANDPTFVILLLILTVAVSIAVFLLLREVVCWYYKINERTKIQKLTLETLLKLYEQNGGDVNWKEVNKIIK